MHILPRLQSPTPALQSDGCCEYVIAAPTTIARNSTAAITFVIFFISYFLLHLLQVLLQAFLVDYPAATAKVNSKETIVNIMQISNSSGRSGASAFAMPWRDKSCERRYK